MAYHRGAHAGSVAVSYSTNAMPTPLSPSRRYSTGNSGTTTSGVSSSSSTKLSSYRSSTSSSFDRPNYNYNSSSSSSSSGYSSGNRSSYTPEYRRYCSPARSLSVSSSSYSETGTGSTSSSGFKSSNNTSSSRYSTPLSSSSSSIRDRSSENRETLDRLAAGKDSTADFYAKYSPANYVPNISASNERNSIINTNGKGTPSSSSSCTVNGYGNNAINNSNSLATPIFGGNSTNARISSFRDNHQDSLLSPSVIQGRPPRAARRSPVNTVINNHAQQPESAANYAEVNFGIDADRDDENLVLIGDKNNNNDNNNKTKKKKKKSNDDNVNINGNSDNDNVLSLNVERFTGNSNYPINTSCGSDFNATVINCRTADIGDSNNFFQNNQNPDSYNNTTSTADGTGLVIAVNSASVSPTINKSNNTLLTNTGEITNNNFETCNGTAADDEDRAADAADFATDSGTLKNDIINPDHFYQTNNITSLANDDLISLFDNKDEESLTGNSLIYLNSGGANTVVRKTVASRPTGNNAGDNNSSQLPSTSRRGDNYSGTGTNSHGTNGIGNTSQLAGTTQQNIYRGINDQIEGSPTIRAPRNRLQAPRDERCGLNGLRNIGNTCFMNSVIQCLSNTRPLLEYLVNEQYLADINTATSSMKGALIKAFSQVIQELWEVGGDHVVNTASLKSQIQRFAPRFMGYSQQDAQEFLRYLLEGLHEDVNRVTVKPQPIHTDIPEHYTDSQKAAESWKRYLRNEDSTIVDVFVGQLRSSLHCTSCGHVSVTLDPFWDLSLPIPTRSGTVKLNQCLEHFTKEEVLDGDEKPTCSKCQMRRKCTKSFSIQKFPKILVIHLKRFSPMERFRGKLNTLVDFPLTGLDLEAFSAPRVAGCTYNLYGVANHSGTTYSGHYTAYCKHPYSGEWHEYNDSRVSSIAARSVVSSEGYVLFYEQQPHSSNL